MEDVGPTLYKCYTNVLCLLGRPIYLITLEALGFFYLSKELNLGSYSISNYYKCFSQLFPFHLNTYVMGLQPLQICVLLQRGDRL